MNQVLNTIREWKGIKAVKILTTDEKRYILEVEDKSEKKIVYGMCRTFNQGMREALERNYTLSCAIDTSMFEYPHHPDIKMFFSDIIVGELVNDPNKIKKLKNNSANFFLWENFVIYTPKLPKKSEDKQKLCIIYAPRLLPQLEKATCVEKGVFGTPSVDSDILIKRLLSLNSTDPMIGTCLIGFNLKIN